MEKLSQIETEILEASQAYYEGEPIMPDEIFDAKVSMLKNIKPDSTILKVGFGYQPVGETAEHLVYPIGSLDKIKQEEVKDLTAILNPNEKDIFVMPKLDGGSIVIYYLKGKLWIAITRGAMNSRGLYEGIVVTDNIRHAVPETLPIDYDVAIRTEIVLTWEDFEKMEGTHPRNLAVGLSRSIHKKRQDIEKLRVVALNICGYRNDLSRETLKFRPEEHSMLKAWGFEVTQLIRISKKDFLTSIINKDTWKNIGKTIDNKYTYPTDGLVLIDPSGRSESTLKRNWNRIDWDSIAFKFEEEFTTTIVKAIEWEMSEKGRAVPVLKVEPVTLSGAVISNVTANNYAWLKNIGCGVGSTIEIVRANEIIPKLKVVKQRSDIFHAPERCFGCDHILINDGTDLKCINSTCGLKIEASIKRIFSHFFPKGVGIKTIEKLIDNFNINSIASISSLFSITSEEFQKVIGNSMTKLVVEGIKNISNYSPSIKEILQFSNIPQVGIVASQNFNELDPEDFSRYVKIKKFPFKYRELCPTVLSWDALNVPEYLQRIEDVINLFAKGIKARQSKNANLGWKVCVTGAVSLSRSEWYKALRQFGIIETNSVSRKTSILVANNKKSTGKFKKAAEFDIPVLTETEFYTAIAKELNTTIEDITNKIISL